MRRALKDSNLSCVQIKTWRKLLVAIRKQASMVSNYLSLPELAFLLQCILQGTACVFLTLTNAYGGSMGGINITHLSYLGWFAWKLCCKSIAAEAVTYAVSLRRAYNPADTHVLNDLQIAPWFGSNCVFVL